MPGPNHQRDGLDRDPFWYKSGVIYEVHVRSFYDANADGAGDFPGLTQKLDYIRDLGVTAVWLLPFYPSPLKDDGYDIADYTDVHPMYGTLGDFKVFLREAHRRGLRVITEMVLNHTSDQHPWFQRARRARPGSRWRNFYVWSDSPEKFKGARIIFNDIEASNWTWDPTAHAYYWHRFFSHQPDLNYENPEIHDVMVRVMDFWFDLGVDGMRLDAVPYLYEREGTACEGLPETHAFLKKLRAHVDSKYGDRMLLAEANQWPEDAVSYFGAGRGDECHMAFHFPLMPRLFMALRMEDRLPIVDILEQTPPIPETSQWALFLRNHDELTLEMVTDEERDYMYRMYAHLQKARLNLGIRRRLAPLLGNDRKRIELLNALLFSLPGTPVLYYGDEIGLGENIYLGDRNGVRTPMQWSSDRNAGFSRANPQSLHLPVIVDPEYHYEANNVEAQLANPHSLLWWTRRLLALRKRWRALGEGRCEFLHPENRKILAYVLRHEQETFLVIANLSRFVQPAELDLSEFKPLIPVELFGRTEFPAITSSPYFLTLGPHCFYWFSLETKSRRISRRPTSTVPEAIATLNIAARWQEIFDGPQRVALEAVLFEFVKHQSWFTDPGTLKSVVIQDSIPVPIGVGDEARLMFLQIETVEGATQHYLLPLAFAPTAEAEQRRLRDSRPILTRLTGQDGRELGVVYDAAKDADFCGALLQLLLPRKRLKWGSSEVTGTGTAILRQLIRDSNSPESSLARPGGNSSANLGDRLELRLFRRIEPGLHPEVELGRLLTRKGFPYAPRLAGSFEYSNDGGAPITLGLATEFVPDTRSAWDYTMDALGRYYDRIISWMAQGRAAPPPSGDALALLRKELTPDVAEQIGTYLESARLLGARTADFHLALASASDDDDVAPEPITPHYQRSLFQSLRTQAIQTFRLLRKQTKTLAPEFQAPAQRAIELEPAMIQHYRLLCARPIAAKRIRIHGDCRLNHLLWTGKDFRFVRFEGDASSALSERRIKRSPLRDAASLARSFHWVAYAGLAEQTARGGIAPDQVPKLEPWVKHWIAWVSATFLKAHIEGLRSSGLLPASEEDLAVMLRAELLGQAVAELGRELAQKTERLNIALDDILRFTVEPAPSAGGADHSKRSSGLPVETGAT